MYVSAQSARRTSFRALLVLAFVSGPFLLNSQQPTASTKNYVLTAQEFLKSMYPNLSGKKRFLTIQTSILYDEPAAQLNQFQLFVGAGPKDQLLGYLGGYMGEKPPKDYKPGPVYPKQFLTVGFKFDNQGRLLSLAPSGPALGNPDANDAFLTSVEDHPEWSDERLAAALKDEGAKYGPTDKKDFTRNLPIRTLQRFLGKMNILSVEFTGLDRPNILPMWVVKAKAGPPAANQLTYELWFEPFKGDLIEIRTIPPAAP
jgi:hypothetical protein